LRGARYPIVPVRQTVSVRAEGKHTIYDLGGEFTRRHREIRGTTVDGDPTEAGGITKGWLDGQGRLSTESS